MTQSTASYGPPRHDALQPDRLGKYEIRGILGKGASGVVYEGFDPAIARRVAIKTVVLPDQDDAETSDDLARFRREAQAAGRLTHPHIVGVHDYGETDRLAYIVMEFVEGITLKPALDRGERFAIPDVIRVMTALLDGLAYRHANGVIHRDIKPANVMLTRDHKIKLADFGIARIESSSLTQAGTMMGTPSYMSPEQFTGHPADARTDIYSAGVLLYQLLTGEKPFEGGITAIMHKVLNVEPPPPSALAPAISPALDAVVSKAMAKRPEARFATAAEFAEALREAGRIAPDKPQDKPPETKAAPRPQAAVAASSHGTRREAASPERNTGLIAGNLWLISTIAAAVIVAVAVSFVLRWQLPGASPGLKASGLKASGPKASGLQASVQSGSPPAAAPRPLFSLDKIRARLFAAMAPVPCALLHGAVTERAARLAGLAGAGQMAEIMAAARRLPVPVQVKVTGFSGPYCPVLDAVRPFATFDATAPNRLALSLINDTGTLGDGQLIMPQLKMPPYPSHLEVDYFSHDGSVFHLYPTPSDPPAIQPASGLLVLGDPKASGGGWAAGPPYGTDMILAIATSAPLFDADRLQVEPDASYLAALRHALSAVRAAKGRVAVSALLLTTAAAGAPAADFGAATKSPTPPPR